MKCHTPQKTQNVQTCSKRTFILLKVSPFCRSLVFFQSSPHPTGHLGQLLQGFRQISIFHGFGSCLNWFTRNRSWERFQPQVMGGFSPTLKQKNTFTNASVMMFLGRKWALSLGSIMLVEKFSISKCDW